MAKTVNNIFNAMTTQERVERAVYAAAKGKRHKLSVRKALEDVEGVARRIREKLVDGSWRPPSVRVGYCINDGIQMKRRVIVHPSFEEQVVHHVVIDFLAPIFMRSFFRWSCGSVPGRGQEEMIAHLMRKVRGRRDTAKYYAKLDVRKCFDTLDPAAVLREIESHYIRDRRVLRLLSDILGSNVVRMPDGGVRSGGVPIGLFTSPWFANIALSRVDHIFKDGHGVSALIRFMDDLFVVHGNRRELARAIADAGAALAAFGLGWKEEPRIVRWADGDCGKVRFCGVQVTRETVELRDRVFIRAVRSAGRIVRKREESRRVTWYDAAKMVSYGGRFRAFEGWRAFVRCVLRDGRISYRSMRRKISAHDKIKARKGK